MLSRSKYFVITSFFFIAYPLELTRKHVSQMFFRGEVEQELREIAHAKIAGDSYRQTDQALACVPRVIDTNGSGIQLLINVSIEYVIISQV